MMQTFGITLVLKATSLCNFNLINYLYLNINSENLTCESIKIFDFENR